MLVASGTLAIGRGAMRSTFMLDRELHVHAVERTGLVFDSRFAPEIPEPSQAVVLTLAPRGTLALRGPGEARFTPIDGFVARESILEGTSSERRAAVRSLGAPFVGVDIRTGGDAFVTPPGDDVVPLGLDPELRDAALALAGAGVDDAPRALHVLLGLLERRGLLVEREREALPAKPKRLWPALRPLVESFNVLPSLDELSLASGMSLRQLARDVDALTATIGLGGGWRALTRRMRLKLAVLALSAEGATVAEIAKLAGYSSADAMGRAFRDAHLPAPSDVRAQLLAE